MQSLKCLALKRKWVKYEIEKAWNEGRGVLGIYIHNLKCPNNGKSKQGANPFDSFTLDKGTKKLSSVVKCYNPNSTDAYNSIKNNIKAGLEVILNSLIIYFTNARARQGI